MMAALYVAAEVVVGVGPGAVLVIAALIRAELRRVPVGH